MLPEATNMRIRSITKVFITMVLPVTTFCMSTFLFVSFINTELWFILSWVIYFWPIKIVKEQLN